MPTAAMEQAVSLDVRTGMNIHRLARQAPRGGVIAEKPA